MKRTLLLALALAAAFCLAAAHAESDACQHDGTRSRVNETPATCVADGWYDMRCDACQAIVETGVVIPATGHAVSDWQTETAPTCQTVGKAVGCCGVCGEAVEKELPITECEYEWTETQPPTCAEPGVSSFQCKYCQTVIETQEIPARSHVPQGDYVIDIPATCTTDGQKHLVCAECGEAYDLAVIPAPGHDFAIETVLVPASTCNEAETDLCGVMEQKCAACGETRTVSFFLPHEVVSESRPATCTELGVERSYCAVCGTEFSRTVTETTDPENHPEEAVVAVEDPVRTCYQGGLITYTCTSCGKVIREEALEPAAHGTIADAEGRLTVRAENLYVAPACERGGDETLLCALCLERAGSEVVVETRHIPATGHDWKFDAMTRTPTCRETGINRYACRNSGCIAAYEVELPKLENHPADVTHVTTPRYGVAGIDKYECPICAITWYEIVEPAEDELSAEGIMTYTCAVCEATFTAAISDADSDTMLVTKEATCTEGGEVTFTCPVCGALETVAIEPMGHNYICAHTAPTCEFDGLNRYSCARCGDFYTETVPPLGHNYETVVISAATPGKDGTKADICTVCGDMVNVTSIEYARTHYNCAMTLDGIPISALDASNTSGSCVAVVNTTRDEVYDFRLIADGRWIVGDAAVTVSNGAITVSYEADALNVRNETIIVYDSLDALRAGEGLSISVGSAVPVSGNSVFIELSAIVDFNDDSVEK